jgi:DNA polymerase-3 subunit alpha
MESIVGPKWSTDTFGILVYQEQLIECVQLLASFTADEADDLRKAIGKKLMDKVLAFKEKFIAGCIASEAYKSHFAGQPLKSAEKVAQKIWDSIEASGRYAFNWSHAVGYALISTWEIWTKHYFPQELLVALMATDSGNVNKYIREARRRNITILPPDINRSDRKFSIDADAIRYGLDTVDHVGAKGCTDILAARPYASLEDYLERAGRGAEKIAVTNLILIGAFDGFGSRYEMLKELEWHRITEDLAASTRANPEKLGKIIAQRQASGKYTMAIMRITRILGSLTVLVLLATILLLFRWEKRRAERLRSAVIPDESATASART